MLLDLFKLTLQFCVQVAGDRKPGLVYSDFVEVFQKIVATSVQVVAVAVVGTVIVRVGHSEFQM